MMIIMVVNDNRPSLIAATHFTTTSARCHETRAQAMMYSYARKAHAYTLTIFDGQQECVFFGTAAHMVAVAAAAAAA